MEKNNFAEWKNMRNFAADFRKKSSKRYIFVLQLET